MRALPRICLAFWLFMIFAFCVYGFFATYKIPGESFCRAMYAVMTGMSAVCIIQVLEPLGEGLTTED